MRKKSANRTEKNFFSGWHLYAYQNDILYFQKKGYFTFHF